MLPSFENDQAFADWFRQQLANLQSLSSLPALTGRIDGAEPGALPEEAQEHLNNAIYATESQLAQSVIDAAHKPASEHSRRIDAAYLQVLFGVDAPARAELYQFLNDLLFVRFHLDEGPQRVTYGLICMTAMNGNPGSGDFLDVAPVAAWVSKQLGVPQDAVNVLSSPFCPREGLAGVSALAYAVGISKNAETLQSFNAEAIPFRAVNAGESPVSGHVVFIVSVLAPDDAEIERIERATGEDNAYADDYTELALPYEMDGVRHTATVVPCDFDYPLSAILGHLYDEEESQLISVFKRLEAAGACLSDYGVSVRLAALLDSEELHCIGEVYRVADNALVYSCEGPHAHEIRLFTEALVNLALDYDLGGFTDGPLVMKFIDAECELLPADAATDA